MNRVARCMLGAALLAGAYPAQALDPQDLDPKTILSRAEELPPPPKIKASGPISTPAKTKSDPGIRSGRFTVAPDWDATPGVLCTRRDRDFDEYRYAERIPHCRRNFSKKEKQEVSRWYGLPWEEHSKYQFDHLLSLCLGGSNSLNNVWPMIYDQARKKAKMEWNLCRRLTEGKVTQKQAVTEELGWFYENIPAAVNRFKAAARLKS